MSSSSPSPSSASDPASALNVTPTVPASENGSHKAWRSEELLHGQKEVLIHHGEETYRLRLTRAGKLILYK